MWLMPLESIPCRCLLDGSLLRLRPMILHQEVKGQFGSVLDKWHSGLRVPLGNLERLVLQVLPGKVGLVQLVLRVPRVPLDKDGLALQVLRVPSALVERTAFLELKVLLVLPLHRTHPAQLALLGELE